MKLAKFITACALTAMTQVAMAGVCEIHIKRTACPGKDKESYAKCDGKAECDTKKKADSADECAKIAADECPNSRLEITKSKEITAKFGGAAVKSKDGKDQFCAADRPDFNKCK